jgi:hypothetical protein
MGLFPNARRALVIYMNPRVKGKQSFGKANNLQETITS